MLATPHEDAALSRLLDTVRAERRTFEAQQQISDDVIGMMKDAGIFRALVARRFGGDEMSPADFMRLIETVAMADGSAGWVASFGHAAVYLAALPVDTLAAIYSDGPDVVFAGALFPPQLAKIVPGGFEVSGRWQFGSGVTGASLVGVGIKAGGGEGNGLPRMAVMPRTKASIARNWDVIGLQGTGSHDIVVDKVVVPEDWTFIRGGQATLTEPLFRYPAMALAAQVLAVVGLGVARAALDAVRETARSRGSITGAPALADRAYVQIDLAKAEAQLRAARAFFYEVTEEAFALLLERDSLPLEKSNLLRLAATHVARVSADVTQSAFTWAGTAAIHNEHPLSQMVRDAMVVAQHAFLSEGTWQSAGRILLGLEPQPGFP